MEEFFEQLRQIRNNKYVRLATPFVRGILMYVIYIAMLNIIVAVIDSTFLKIDVTVDIWMELFAKLLMIYFLLNTVILAFATYDRTAREAFLKKALSEFSLAEEKKLLLKNSAFWYEIAVLCACFILFILPSGYDVIFRAVGVFYDAPKWLHKPLLTLLFAGLTIYLSLKNQLEVRQLWLNMPNKLMKKQFWKSLEQKKKQQYSNWRLVLRLIGYTLLYCLEAYMIVILIPYVISILRILLLFLREGWQWSIPIFLILPVLYYGRAFLRRKKFVRSIKKLCREYNYELFDLKHPYLSLLRDGRSYTFGIRTKGKTYLCRILAGVRNSNKMYLSDNGTCIRSFGVHAPTARLARSGPFAQVYVRKDEEDLELFRMTSTSNYTFEGEGEKILIINPVPRKVYTQAQGMAPHEADNGDTVGEYRIYTGNAFLRSLERSEY